MGWERQHAKRCNPGHQISRQTHEQTLSFRAAPQRAAFGEGVRGYTK
ncbi:hypothetical protein APY03_1518 [Variovorax sp. WDL1]|nr:hypothetical protein APY03_1518 [Variovorax sp. WDL1]